MKKNIRFLFFYKKQIFVLVLLDLLSSVLSLIGPYFSKLFIDKAFIDKNLAKFLNLSILGAAIFIFSMLVKAVGEIIKNRIATKLKLSLANRFIRKFYSLDLSFFQSKSVGENVYQLYDIENIANFIIEQCPPSFRGYF